MSLRDGAKAKLGGDLWKQYFKFTIVRNPFDRAVSVYYWLTKHLEPNSRPPLFDWICGFPAPINNNWTLYTENDDPMSTTSFDSSGSQADLLASGSALGFPDRLYEAVSDKPMKTTQRPKEGAYRRVIDGRSRELISHL